MIISMFRAQYFMPDGHYPSILDIDFEALYSKGIRLLLIDLDNTLAAYDETMPSDRIQSLIETVRKIGFDIVIVSNNSERRVRPYAEALGLKSVHRAKKPLKGGLKKAMAVAKKHVGIRKTCLIGDQLLTDVYGAKRLALSVMLVKPLKKHSEKWYTRFNRRIERRILKRLKRKYPESYQTMELEKRLT